MPATIRQFFCFNWTGNWTSFFWLNDVGCGRLKRVRRRDLLFHGLVNKIFLWFLGLCHKYCIWSDQHFWSIRDKKYCRMNSNADRLPIAEYNIHIFISLTTWSRLSSAIFIFFSILNSSGNFFHEWLKFKILIWLRFFSFPYQAFVIHGCLIRDNKFPKCGWS